MMYAAGQGMPLDNVQAHKWYALAATRFINSDQGRAAAAAGRDAVAAKMTAAQIAEAQRLARAWRQR